jgi:hypothetical protein
MPKLSGIGDASARLIGNCIQGRGAAAIGATASAVTTSNAITSVIDGIARNVAAMTNQALVALASADFVAASSALAQAWRQPAGLVGFYVQPAATTVYYVLAVNAAGTVRTVQGTYQGQPLQPGIHALGDGTIPDVPDTWVPFAVVKVTTTASTFTPGTTALTGIATLYDVAVLPSVDRL